MPQSRQLAAIMFTDIVGYTKLMGDDETRAFEILSQNRTLHRPIIEKYNGRLIKELGDGVMASFSSVSDAVNAAMEIREQCKVTATFTLRIGIHQGEIVMEDGDVFGDAVNIASRIQTIAQPGEIYISETVNNNLANKTGIHTRFVKEQKLKNVKQPIRIFKISETAAPFLKLPAKKKMLMGVSVILLAVVIGLLTLMVYSASIKTPGDSQNSIAVLSFVNMSNDPDQEYFSVGLSEEVLNMLAKVNGLKVIARTSSFSFKGKNADVKTISEKLGVSHILEGSVRKYGNHLRVTAQLIKSADGSQLWSDVYEKELDDVFKIQDEIATSVVSQLKLKLAPNANLVTGNPEAHNLVLQGNYFFEHLDELNVTKALNTYKQALQIDSLDPRTWAMIAKVYSRSAWQNYIPQQEGYEKARKTVMRALALDPDNIDALITLAGIRVYYDFAWDDAEKLVKKVLSSEPTNVNALNMMAVIYQSTGQLQKAISFQGKALLYDPLRPIFYSNQGANYSYTGKYDKANDMYRKCLDINPGFQRAHMYIGRNYLLQGKPALALKEMEQENFPLFKHFGLILVYHALGQKATSDSLLKSFVQQYSREWPYLIAEIYGYRNEKKQAVQWLQQAYIQNDSWLVWVYKDPLLKSIWNEDGYRDILHKMNIYD